MLSEEQIYNAKVLVVDDQDVSIKLLDSILRKAGYKHITAITDSRKAFETYKQIRPDILLLDLNMPGCDGFEVMKQLARIDEGSYLPILVISGVEDKNLRFKALASGAKDFLIKPYDRVEVLIRIHNILEVRMLHDQVVNQNVLLEEKVRQRTRELHDTQLDVIQRLARAVEYRDSETGLHIIRMSHYSAALAAKVGLSFQKCDQILTASPLHDIGKIAIPDNILLKPGRLTDEEMAIMKTHTTIGAELLSGSQSEFLEAARRIALTHHERWDGSGYPKGLVEEEIPIEGRISAICDVFDALTTKRPYKKAWDVSETIEEIKSLKEKHFDPSFVDLFVEILPEIQEIKNQYNDPQKAEDD